MGNIRKQPPRALLQDHPRRTIATKRRNQPVGKDGASRFPYCQACQSGGLMRLPRWLRWRSQKELEEELEAHLDLETQTGLERGMTRADAEAAARRHMGNLTRIAEQARESDPFAWMFTVIQ